MWAVIKKALNSTLGTNGFKPLNELLQRNIILVPSNNIYRLLFFKSGGEIFTSSAATIGKIKFDCGGCVKVSVSISEGSVKIQRKNSLGNVIGAATISSEDTISNRVINIKKGDSLIIKTTVSNSEISALSILADEISSEYSITEENITDDMGNLE